MERSREKLREALAALLEDSFADDAVRSRVDARRDAGRYFTPNEQAVLTPAARGYLLKLVGGCQITRMQMELILHYVMLFWTAPVGVRDLEDLLDQVVFGLAPEDLEAVDPWETSRKH